MRSHAIFLNALLCVGWFCFLAGLPQSAHAQKHPPDLTEMSLEELLNIEVITAGKKEQTLAQVPAAVYVITQEEIRRSGATRLPELLRLVPGVQVAQINANTWAVSIRGFNYRYSNKLLVLIDGRTVYSPIFSGVFWDMQNLVLEDIERIEVIRGPGGTLWGANAVNGVINVITKRAQDTQGALISASTGSQGQAMTEARYGGQNQQKQFSYRLYSKYFLEGQSPGLTSVHSAYDAWSDFVGGFRSDWQAAPRDLLVFSGEIYRASEQQTYHAPLLQPPFSENLTLPLKATEGNLMLNWQHQFAGGSLSSLQAYYDHLDRFFLPLDLQQQIFDINFQHQLRVRQRHEVVVGAEFRLNQENMRNSDILSFSTSAATQNIFSGFVQDDITLPASVWLTLGSKFESNTYTGLEAQPSARLRWKPHAAHSFWAAISRAIRTPSRYEDEVRINVLALPTPAGVPALLTLFGDQQLISEKLLAYELGYRNQPASSVSLDIALFYNSYKDIIGFQAGEPFLELTPAPPHLVIPNLFANNLSARTKGIELAATYKPRSGWKFSAGYSWLQIRQTSPPGSASLMLPGDVPRHQFDIRSYCSLPLGLEFDNAFFYTSSLTGQRIPAYARWDSRLGWRSTEHLEFSLALQNLLDPHHPEFVQLYDVEGPAQVGRRVQGGITWHF
jgi:iron complex outermembrane recepter protein